MKQIEFRRLTPAEDVSMRRALREVEMNHTGLTQRGLTRRQFVKTSAGVIGVSFLPLGLGSASCDPATMATLISAGLTLIDTLKSVFQISEDVRGRVQLINDGDREVNGELLLQLNQKLEDLLADEGVAPFSVAPGDDPIYEYGNLYAASPGSHNVKGTLGQQSKKTVDFDVVG